uniref:Uncharacterized protein n=1 Tax=uncultured marine virus TaxID=186617 RepID=A0A0F7LAS1_9VIRU|nr:hypothetical protein [uncultured marine virus]
MVLSLKHREQKLLVLHFECLLILLLPFYLFIYFCNFFSTSRSKVCYIYCYQ